MALSRRGFLKLLGSGVLGAAALATLDVDKLLWVPGERTIFLPALEPVTMSVETMDWLTRRAMQLLKENLMFTNTINQEYGRRAIRGHVVNVSMRLR